MTSPLSQTATAAVSSPAIQLTDVRFAYEPRVELLHVPSLALAQGERVFIFGPSGSGKTTLLSVMAGVLRATTGSVKVLGQELSWMSNRQRDAFRGTHIGYIFQLFNLIPYLSVLDNILLPCRLHPKRRQRLAGTLLDEAGLHLATQLGIEDCLPRNVLQLSVGQQQRVAAARALLGAPPLLLADEPTSALDTDHREQFLELLFQSCQRVGTTLVFVSHDRAISGLFDRSVSLLDINTVRG